MSADNLSRRAAAKEVRNEQDYVSDTCDQKIKARPSKITLKSVLALVIAVVIPVVSGILVGKLFNPSANFYIGLKKPAWTPPDIALIVTWLAVHLLMGVASWLVWIQGGFQRQGFPLASYVLQLILNLLWPVLLFGLQDLGAALIDIYVLVMVVIVCAAVFGTASRLAAYLFLPYLAWILFATALNAQLYILNQ